MRLRDGRFSRCYSIVWLRELVLGLLEALTISKHECSIVTLVDVGHSALFASTVRRDSGCIVAGGRSLVTLS